MTNNDAIVVIECVLTDMVGNYADKEMPEYMKRLFESLEKAEKALEFANDLIGYISKNYMDETEAEIMCRKLLKHGLIELNNDGDYVLEYEEAE